MRITQNGRGSSVAIALSGLAVAIAATGTAVAVAPSVFSIADHAHPRQYLKIDSSGRLTAIAQTKVQLATLNVFASARLAPGGHDFLVTSPTTAQLAVTRIAATTPPSNTSTYQVGLNQMPVTASGKCDLTHLTKFLTTAFIRPGDNLQADYATPLLIKPRTPTTPYCLDLYLTTTDTAGANDAGFVEFTGYVASGRYTGIGTSR